MKTTQYVSEPGLYSSACCEGDLIYYRDDHLARCPNCGQLCDWHFVESVIPWNEAGHLAGWAD
jgi:hypothetical protein